MHPGLRHLAKVNGAACVGIGVVHLLAGTASVPGEGLADATVDSRERFYGAVFAGYGLTWVWAARQAPVDERPLRVLAGVFLAGGLGRVLSWKVEGRPHGFQLVLMAIELVLPVPFLLSRTSTTASGSPTTTPVNHPDHLGLMADLLHRLRLRRHPAANEVLRDRQQTTTGEA